MNVLNSAVCWERSKHGGITHFRWVNHRVCELYLNKTLAKHTQKREGLVQPVCSWYIMQLKRTPAHPKRHVLECSLQL